VKLKRDEIDRVIVPASVPVQRTVWMNNKKQRTIKEDWMNSRHKSRFIGKNESGVPHKMPTNMAKNEAIRYGKRFTKVLVKSSNNDKVTLLWEQPQLLKFSIYKCTWTKPLY
jgi:hypothetical protein